MSPFFLTNGSIIEKTYSLDNPSPLLSQLGKIPPIKEEGKMDSIFSVYKIMD